MEMELSGFVYLGAGVRVPDLPQRLGARSRPRLRTSGVERRREAVVTFPGWRAERTQSLEVDCPLSRRRETRHSCASLSGTWRRHVRLASCLQKAILKGNFETVQI